MKCGQPEHRNGIKGCPSALVVPPPLQSRGPVAGHATPAALVGMPDCFGITNEEPLCADVAEPEPFDLPALRAMKRKRHRVSQRVARLV